MTYLVALFTRAGKRRDEMTKDEARIEVRRLGDKIRCGDEVYGDQAAYDRAMHFFYADRHAVETKPGWWNLPMAEWAWKGDARQFGG